MLSLLSRFWVEAPISYALTVGGLIAGFRRGGVPSENRISRAVLAGLPVMLAAAIFWNIIISVCEPQGTSHQFVGLNLLLGLVFVSCWSALAGVVLARREPTGPRGRGAAILDDTAQDSDATRPGELTLAGVRIAPLDETKHFKIMGTTGTGKSTAISELLIGAIARDDRAKIGRAHV